MADHLPDGVYEQIISKAVNRTLEKMREQGTPFKALKYRMKRART